MNYKVVIDTDELKEIRKKMETLYNEFDAGCINCVRKADETKDFFYTPTADYFREQVSDYIYQNLKKMGDSMNSLESALDRIIQSYDDMNSTVKTSVGGE